MSGKSVQLSLEDVPTGVKYRALKRGLPVAAGTGVPEDAERKEKDKKKGQQAAVREVPLLDTPDAGAYGDLKLIQSRYKTDRVWTPVGDFNKSLAGQKVWCRARVHTVRGAGKTTFLVLRRGLATVQAVVAQSETIPKEMVKYASKIPDESLVDVCGSLTETKEPTKTSQSDVELQVERIYVVAESALVPFKLDDAARKEGEGVTVGQDLRLDNRWIDLRTPANHAIFRLQTAVSRYFRDFFLSKNFFELHTPKITPGVSEGGSQVFRTDYFGQEACLAQSPQLYKQMGICSDFFGVFEIGPVFRAEDSNTHRHMCEFTGLDFEMEIMEHYSEVLKMLGDLFTYIFDHLNKNHALELKTVCQQYPFEPLKYNKETLIIHFPDAIKMLRDAGEKIGDFDDFTTPQEKKLGELVRKKFNTDFYIVDHYPLNVRPFYTMPNAEDPRYSNSYDVFLRGEEITSGAQRVHDVKLLLERAAVWKIPENNIAAYVNSFKYGTSPHGGAGIGLERVVMLFMGLDNIRKTSMFPRTPARLAP